MQLASLAELCTDAVRLRGAELSFPSNRETPIAARLDLVTASGAEIEGVGLEPAQAEPVISFLTSRGASNDATLARAMRADAYPRRASCVARTLAATSRRTKSIR